MTDNTNDRRDFVKTAVLAAAVLAAKDAGFPAIAKGASPVILPALPWADDALEPFISKNTIGFHYGKHHKTYVETLNGLVAGKPEADMDLVSIVKGAAGKPDKAAVFNSAAQVWNHTFYWNSLRPKSDAKMPKEIAGLIDASFEGGYEGFKKEFSGAAMGQFGRGSSPTGGSSRSSKRRTPRTR
jgi:Fe-Mn family superoxide dismutase